MRTDGTTLADLAGQLFALYVAVSLGFVGFGLMLGGKVGAQQVARFFFVRPLAGLGAATRYRAWQLIVLLWQAAAAMVVFVVGGTWRTVMRPIGRFLWRAARWPFQSGRRFAVIVAVIVLCALTVVAFAAGSPAGAQTVSIRARSHNMFYTEVTIDGRITAPALIDTGATYVVLCQRAAARLGLRLGRSISLLTGNGIVSSRQATLRSLRIGPIEVKDVAAVVVNDQATCHDSFTIGMTVLSRLQSVTLRGQTLILVGHAPPSVTAASTPKPWYQRWWGLGFGK